MKIYVFRVTLGADSQTVLERAGYTKDEISDEMRYGAKQRIIELIEELAEQENRELWKKEDINEDEIGG